MQEVAITVVHIRYSHNATRATGKETSTSYIFKLYLHYHPVTPALKFDDHSEPAPTSAPCRMDGM